MCSPAPVFCIMIQLTEVKKGQSVERKSRFFLSSSLTNILEWFPQLGEVVEALLHYS